MSVPFHHIRRDRLAPGRPSPVGPAIEPTIFPRTSTRAAVLGATLRHGVRPTVSAWSLLPLPVFPPNLVELASATLPDAPGTTRHRVNLPDCAGEIVTAPGVAHSGRIVLYFHGGAFFSCGLNSHRRIVSRLSHAADQPVLHVEYRQMPHASVATSIADGVAAFRWLLQRGHRPEEITIAGDSAGGYLAFSVVRAVLDAGLGRPAGLVGISPLLEIDPGPKSDHRNARDCQAFSPASLRRLAAAIARVDLRTGAPDGRTCPVDMDVADFPPVLLHVGSREILLHDSERMANTLLAAGVACSLQIWTDQVHVFHAAAGWLPEARLAFAEIGTFVRALA